MGHGGRRIVIGGRSIVGFGVLRGSIGVVAGSSVETAGRISTLPINTDDDERKRSATTQVAMAGCRRLKYFASTKSADSGLD